jgi:hypothetical protein
MSLLTRCKSATAPVGRVDGKTSSIYLLESHFRLMDRSTPFKLFIVRVSNTVTMSRINTCLTLKPGERGSALSSSGKT